jgi:hypothetical protein
MLKENILLEQLEKNFTLVTGNSNIFTKNFTSIKAAHVKSKIIQSN